MYKFMTRSVNTLSQIALLKMLGDVSIKDCSFSHNKQYEGHGAAIHYSNNMLLHSPIKFMISG